MGRLLLALPLAFAVLAWPGHADAAKGDSLASTTSKARAQFNARSKKERIFAGSSGSRLHKF